MQDILTKFPGPATLPGNRLRWIVWLGACLLLLVLAANTRAFPSLGWIPIASFSAGAIYAAVMMIPGVSQLTLDRDGFAVSHGIRQYRYKWSEVEDFHPRMFPRGVLIDWRSPSRVVFYRLSAAELASEGSARGVIPDNFNFTLDDLTELMNAWRQRALAGQ